MEAFTESTMTAVINAPLESINLTEWLFTLTDQEYKQCSSAHIACGNSLSTEGKRMSINVEQIADNLLIQHYVEDVAEKDHCSVNSISDSLSPSGRTTLGIKWELKLAKISESSCELSNHVVVYLTEDFQESMKKLNISDLDPIKNDMSAHLREHNQEETPLFAKDIESKALAGVWS
ncbi:hypothetical protein SAMN05443633_1179 [Chryseobacterium arachidis]|uniref:Polyketide cyclase / dehydrase and lipid transport n=1 Tax=Chryseobacterium arachidis TaxID=1416778 RepID=A0A1M5KLS6_9FLAO|nr:hypothetical protein [Chryseobacterium arachidis]SHG53153.1 hypothetical protein SAMN05443633_1179 [Chryseobacterium arachidis]